MKTNTKPKRNRGNFLVIGAGLVIVPIIGIGIGYAIGHFLRTTVVVPDPKPAPMIELHEDHPMLMPNPTAGEEWEGS